jgi:hypothetical protein
MNVHITCTPEFSFEKLEEIVSLLISIPGELKFIKGKPLTQVQYKRLNEKFENIDQISGLEFEEFFELVQWYRELREIGDNDFVILISSIRNTRNWFSSFNEKNIFIHGDEWDLISDVDSKFGLAYQCVGNIFHSLMELKINDFHKTAIDCISDFCGHKPDILKKLRSANICQSCYERSVNKGISDLIMTHIISIMEEIRKEFVISKKFSRQANLEKVQIDSKGKITIGGKIIKMDLLPRVMYICFLKNINGFPTEQLCENKDKFEKIYRLIKKNPDEYAIIKMCCNKINYSNRIERRKPTFETYRSKIRRALIDKLGQTLSNYYSVNLVEDQNKQNFFKVKLKKENLDISTNFYK